MLATGGAVRQAELSLLRVLERLACLLFESRRDSATLDFDSRGDSVTWLADGDAYADGDSGAVVGAIVARAPIRSIIRIGVDDGRRTTGDHDGVGRGDAGLLHDADDVRADAILLQVNNVVRLERSLETVGGELIDDELFVDAGTTERDDIVDADSGWRMVRGGGDLGAVFGIDIIERATDGAAGDRTGCCADGGARAGMAGGATDECAKPAPPKPPANAP